MRKKKNVRAKKLQQRISKLKAKVKTMDERNRRLRKKRFTKKKDSTKSENKELQDHEILRQLSCKFFSLNFARLFSAQIDTHIKNKRGRRYSSEFKQFALCLYFLSPRSYKKLKKELALPSVRSLQTFTQKWKIKPKGHLRAHTCSNSITKNLHSIFSFHFLEASWLNMIFR